jgi:hypothetical protein
MCWLRLARSVAPGHQNIRRNKALRGWARRMSSIACSHIDWGRRTGHLLRAHLVSRGMRPRQRTPRTESLPTAAPLTPGSRRKVLSFLLRSDMHRVWLSRRLARQLGRRTRLHSSICRHGGMPVPTTPFRHARRSAQPSEMRLRTAARTWPDKLALCRHQSWNHRCPLRLHPSELRQGHWHHSIRCQLVRRVELYTLTYASPVKRWLPT